MEPRKCAVDWCIRPWFAREWCKPHYNCWRKHGDATAVPIRDFFVVGVPEGHQRCTGCHTIKPFGDFSPNRACRNGLQQRCKHCMGNYAREWTRGRDDEWREQRRQYEKRQKARANYGLSPEEYDALFADGGRCVICGSDGGGRWRRPHIDHCHECSGTRGLLCHECNTALGLAGEDSDRLRRMADYIDRHRAEVRHLSGR